MRRERAVAFGPCMRLQFENRTTVRQHVEKMLRIERITDPGAVQQEVDAYAHLLPDAAYPFRALIGAPAYARLLDDFAPAQPLSTRASPCVNRVSPTSPT